MFSTRLQSNRTYAQAVALLVVFSVILSAVSSIVSVSEVYKSFCTSLVQSFSLCDFFFYGRNHRNVTLIDNRNSISGRFSKLLLSFLISVSNMDFVYFFFASIRSLMIPLSFFSNTFCILFMQRHWLLRLLVEPWHWCNNNHQLHIVTQNNCDLKDTSIMQADKKVFYVNANCEYDTAVNVSHELLFSFCLCKTHVLLNVRKWQNWFLWSYYALFFPVPFRYRHFCCSYCCRWWIVLSIKYWKYC